MPSDLTADGRVDEFMRRVVEFARLENGVFPPTPSREPSTTSGTAKTDPIQAIDGVTNRLTQKMVAVLATLKKPLSSSAGKA